MAGTIQSLGERLTLRTALLTSIGVLLVMFLVGNLVLNLVSARHALQKQMSDVVQDTATALALSVAQPLGEGDEVKAATLLEAVYDRGFFEHVILWNAAGEARLVKHDARRSEMVPDWFAGLLSFDPPAGQTDVVSGWKVLGAVSVKASEAQAMEQLWWTFKVEVAWFSFALLLVVVALMAIVNSLLRPLESLTGLADAIKQRDFSKRIAEVGVVELRMLCSAMNGMAEKLDDIFSEQVEQIEGLRQALHFDPLTGLLLRDEFDRRLTARLHSRDEVVAGNILLLQVKDFANYNHQFGREAGDRLIQRVADIVQLRSCKTEGAILARRSGADFAVYLPGMPDDDANRLAEAIIQNVSSLAEFREWCRHDVINAGLVAVESGEDLAEALSNADFALRSAQKQGNHGWQRFFEASNQQPEVLAQQAYEWQSMLSDYIAREHVALHFQGVFSKSGSVLYYKALARMEINDKLTEAAVFLPMVDRFDLHTEFDKLIVRKVIQVLDEHLHYGARVGLTLSTRSLLEESFVQWLVDEIERHPAAAHCMLLEIPEFVLQRDESAFSRLMKLSVHSGVELVIDRFGAAALPFSYLHRWHPKWIKLDRHFIENIKISKEHQFYIRAISQVAHSQGVRVLAYGLEDQSEWTLLQNLGVDAGAGFGLQGVIEHIDLNEHGFNL
ncbi:signal transduction diguanylate cyclase/phosphodiesterase [Oleiphilus messinensis]|uniref:Signal transduction diguanylate cyclase/phosphodiesterase n=1 Tax=Oleiphilus messinensis TaxID=141451 RepID=A0A1Y0I3L8_9GAMM|nr:EAL domain-containing protein [Oleiphilus messinensis]ARU55067.1 signal transduction diguanylate cyclase/phosphodiesterase [Oleiphilus messinensis]